MRSAISHFNTSIVAPNGNTCIIKHGFFCPVVNWLTSGFVYTAVSLNWFMCHLQTFEKFNIQHKGIYKPIDAWSFLQKMLFWTFWWSLRWISAKLALIWPKMHFPTRQLAFLATGVALYDISTWACAFRFFAFFFAFPFSPFLFFLLQRLTFDWACLRLKNF